MIRNCIFNSYTIYKIAPLGMLNLRYTFHPIQLSKLSTEILGCRYSKNICKHIHITLVALIKIFLVFISHIGFPKIPAFQSFNLYLSQAKIDIFIKFLHVHQPIKEFKYLFLEFSLCALSLKN